MNQISYRIQLKSLNTCLEHMRTLGLDEMEVSRHATDAERIKISAVRACLLTIPA
jgi:hypothetical protein